MKKCWLVFVVAAILWPMAASANQPKTYFDYLERAWAVGEIRARSSLKFRDGLVLVFPGTIVDLTYGRLGKAHSIMLVDELTSKDDTSPIPLKAPFYAPINVLPKYSYWRDNLPNTPQHEIPGGRRYLFVGDDIEPVKKITKAYTDTFAIDMPDRRIRQQALLVGGLESPVSVIREDALRRLESLPIPASYYDDATQKALAAYAAGDAPEADRARAIGVIARAEMKMLIPDLEKLSTHNDIVGGAALIALDHLGEKIPTDRLLKLADSDTFEIQVFAVSELGEMAGDDEKAFEKVVAVLESDESVELRSAAGASLGKSGASDAVEPLRKALLRGDYASRGAAVGLAELATPESIAVLKSAVIEGPNEARIAGVLALVRPAPSQCTDCRSFLLEQLTENDDEAVRDLVPIVLELPAKHEH